MATARAAVMADFNKPLEVLSLPLPSDLSDGDVLVKVSLAGVCGTDVHLHKGELKVPLPLIMGHETIGAVWNRNSKPTVTAGTRP